MTILKNKIFLAALLLISNLAAKPTETTAITAANQVIDALQGKSEPIFLGGYLLEIAHNGHNLPEEQKRQLAELGFDFTGKYVVYSRPTLDYYYDTGIFRIHYSTSGINAVSTTDTDSDGIPDYVEAVTEAFEQTYAREVTEIGFTRPPDDNGTGGSNAFDIYLVNLPSNYYAITYPDSKIGNNPYSTATEVNAYSSYMEIRNNYSGFPNTELENIQVTAAHEFFHAIQFGYDGWDAQTEIWMLEGTAVLMEEVVFDDVNDCYQYLDLWFDYPERALKRTDLHAYSSFILFKYIEEHLGGLAAIKKIFEKSIEYDSYYDDYSITEIDQALQDKGSSFKEAYNGMSIANLVLSSAAAAGVYSYEEAEGYLVETGGIKIESTLSFSAGDSIIITNGNLNEYSAQYYRINTSNPAKATITNLDGPASDLQLHSVAYSSNGNIFVQSGNAINIPGADENYLVIVAQDNEGNDWDFRLFIQEYPSAFSISTVYPNPFKPAGETATTLTLDLISTKEQEISVNIYDLLGRRTRKLYEGEMDYGYQPGFIIWNGRDSRGMPVASGIYFITVEGKDKMEVRKITIVK